MTNQEVIKANIEYLVRRQEQIEYEYRKKRDGMVKKIKSMIKNADNDTLSEIDIVF